MKHVIHDGGRAAAGYKGKVSDCVTRAIAIVTERDYNDIYYEVSQVNAAMPKTKRRKRGQVGNETAAHGVYTESVLFKRLMFRLGFVWIPTMTIGSGCKVHLKSDELPPGRLIVRVTKHYAAVIDGVLYDTHDCSRGGTRCVYGYWKLIR